MGTRFIMRARGENIISDGASVVGARTAALNQSDFGKPKNQIMRVGTRIVKPNSLTRLSDRSIRI